MKKFLLSLALLGGATMAANAEIAFLYDGEEYTSGTIDYKGYTYTPGENTDGSFAGYYTLKIDPEIHIVSTSNTNVTVVASSDRVIAMCAGGDCEFGETVTKTGVPLVADTPLNLLMDWNYPGVVMPGNDPQLPSFQVKLTASTASETISITVLMGGVTAGVESIAASNENMVNVVGKSLNYDLSAASQISVYSLSGKTVMAETVSGNGSISLASLPKGIYLYKVGGNNGKSGKFVLR